MTKETEQTITIQKQDQAQRLEDAQEVQEAIRKRERSPLPICGQIYDQRPLRPENGQLWPQKPKHRADRPTEDIVIAREAREERIRRRTKFKKGKGRRGTRR